MLLQDKVALVIGGGQTPGETIGNGRATAIGFAREGAKVMVADQDAASAAETVAMITSEGGTAEHVAMDVTEESQIASGIAQTRALYGRLDILHNNVGISLTGGDARTEHIEPEAFDHLVAVNLRAMVLASKHTLPIMREQGSGNIINISSMAATKPYPLVGYKTTKAAIVALTEQLAAQNARYNIRVNVILPGLMNTPMAIEARVAAGTPRAEVVAERDRQVPLGRRMGSAWDVANAAAFLASDRAAYITGITLPVDGGLSVV